MSFFKWRIITPWLDPDGGTIWSPSKSFLNWEDMKHPTPDTKAAQFATYCSKLGFNGIACSFTPDKHPEAFQAYTIHLKEKGISTFLRRAWCGLEGADSYRPASTDKYQRPSKELCPYSARTEQFWHARMAKDFAMAPDLAGYTITGAGYLYSNGAPWLCDCEKCKAHTEWDRTLYAVRMMAKLLAEYNATLFWQVCQDDPNGQYEETFYFDNYTGRIPENAFIVVNDMYWDYYPGYPRHSLFGRINKDENGKSQYVTSIQLAGEYRGVHKFPWQQVDVWSEVFRDMAATGQTGLWVMAIVKYNGWDHPLNLVNWYAISKLSEDPFADPAQIKLEWAAETYGEKAAPVVVKVVNSISGAASRMFMFKGLWTQYHSDFPELNYLETRLCGPYHSERRKGWIGHDWPLYMYPPKRIAEIRANPETCLAFTPEPITEELKAEMTAQENEATRLAEEAVESWRTLEGTIGADAYEEVLGLLRGNVDDTIIWRMAMEMYMGLKLGTLTEERIDTVLAECKAGNLKGTILPDPLAPSLPHRHVFDLYPSTLKTFAEQLRQEVKKPTLDEHWSKNYLVDPIAAPMCEITALED